MRQNNKSQYTLGVLPWSKEILEKAYFKDFQITRRAIKEHPGFLAHFSLQSLALSYDIFNNSIEDLFQSIKLFETESSSENFWFRSEERRFNKLELFIRRGIFSSTASAMAFVDNCRRVSKDFKPENYEKIKKHNFEENEEHKFIQGLRNYVSHFRMIEADWHISWNDKERQLKFLLLHEKLSAWNNWTSLAKKFINRHVDGISVVALFDNYRKNLSSFNDWYRKAIEESASAELLEYRKYERILNIIDTQCLMKN